ncbi:MAG TPA: hypothetical protein VET69_11735 [Terriglobales bacterium]|nr:hypothetical protein [Terriglobales bacterium]
MLRGHSRVLWVVLCATLLPSFSLGLFAQEFSADLVQTGRSNSNGPTKIFVGKDKMRIEGSERGQLGGGAMIIDFANQKTLMLMPAQKMYIESMPNMGPNKKDIWFRADDPNNACPQFEAMAKKSNDGPVSCRKIGPDTVNGRAAIKYEGSSKNGTGYAWIDPKLRFLLKWENIGKGNMVELRNIQEGTQDPRLFEVPSDYHKFDMQQMQQRRRP